MIAHKLFGPLAIAAILGAPVFAADPPAADAPPASSAAEQPMDAATALEKARELRKRADGGDAAAMYELGTLLAEFGPGSYTPDSAHMSEWKEVGGFRPPSSWISKAAEAGSQPAIEVVCRMGKDPLAPARLREQGAARCDELRAKYPAK